MVASRIALLLALAALLQVYSTARAAEQQLSGENVKVEFVGTKKDGSHTGEFKKLSGTAVVEGTDPSTLALDVVIDIASMETDHPKLTAHLKSPDFFDVKRYPEAKFVSKKVAKAKKGYTVTGDLTMHGKTSELTFPAEIAVTSEGLKFTAKFKLNRNDWGISYGAGMINDDVDMQIAVVPAK